MSGLEKMKNSYEDIRIPEELHVRVEQEISKSRKQWESKHKYNPQRIIRGMAVTAAAVCVVFTTALNTSYVFAQGAAQFPVIRELAQILTFRSYETEENDIAVSVEIPTIEMIAKDTGISVDEINQEILDCCNQYADEAMVRAEEYRTAFLETGGTLEEWAAHDIQIVVNYEIKQQSNDYLSFIVRGMENWVSAYSESRYYNLDLSTGNRVTLKDMLGDNYMELVNESIKEQIAAREEAGEVFFTVEEGGFTGISENVKFYINRENHPVIVFEKYEIAPGFAGEVEFEVGGNENEKEY